MTMANARLCLRLVHGLAKSTKQERPGPFGPGRLNKLQNDAQRRSVVWRSPKG